MSHPFEGTPSLPFDTVSNPQSPLQTEDIHEALAKLPQPRKHNKWYNSTALAASDMDNPKEDLHTFLLGYFYLKSANWKANDPKPLNSGEAAELAKLPYYYTMPLNSTMREAVKISLAGEDLSEVMKQCDGWLDKKDLNIYVQEFSRTGFQGGLNWYRVATDPKNMTDVELFVGRTIDVPSMFISGKKDWGTYREPGAIEKMNDLCTQFRGVELVDKAGHWVQQEQPENVIELVSKFLRVVKKDTIFH